MCLFPKKIITPYGDERIVCCGKCVECSLRDTREWAVRIMLEAREHDDNCVITLTYDNEHNPGQLVKRDYQLFLKQLRKALYPRKIRYFCSGEYGERHGRPHYHMIIFGWKPDDLTFWKKGKRGSVQFRSSFLEKYWRNGFLTVGELSYETAYYTAKYLQKIAFSRDDIQSPFVAMSTHPGIGANAFNIGMLADDRVIYHGMSIRLPRYFEKLAVKQGYSLDALRTFREDERSLYSFGDKLSLKARRAFYFHKFGILRKSY